MGYEIDYVAGERAGCTSKLTIADRIFYVKLFMSGQSRFFNSDQQGIIQKEISKTEIELWVKILTDNETEALEIQKKLSSGKKY
jgi:hypothetical protein